MTMHSDKRCLRSCSSSVLLVPLFCGSTIPAAIAQTPSRGLSVRQHSQAAIAYSRTLSTPTMYLLLFREMAVYSKTATRLDHQGVPSTFFRSYHQKLFGLSPSQGAMLTSTALACVAKVAPIDQRAYAIISAAKKPYKGSRQPVPPPPPELGELQKARDEAVQQAIEQLHQAYGPAESAYFENQLRSYVGSHLQKPRVKGGAQ